MKNIAICVCTRKRPEGLNILLKSLESLIIPENVKIRVMIVENDSEDFSRNIVEDFVKESRLDISYFLETKQGISFARNRSIKEAGKPDFYCFVDDDQKVNSDWLKELVDCQLEFDSEGAFGQNPPIFSKKVPSYIESFHTPEVFEYGTEVKKAATNCLLIKRESLEEFEGPFDLKLNYSGGEDTFLTSQIVKKGGVIRYNPRAIAHEVIPEERTTIKYVAKRTFRVSNTRLLVLSLLGDGSGRAYLFMRLSMRLALGSLILIPYFLIGGRNKLKGLMKVYDALGGYYYLLGRKNIFYK